MKNLGANDRPEGKRWSRLKPICVDYLESIGLPSKGDNRLLDFTTQENYFSKIEERYNQAHSTNGSGNDLDDAFASFSFDGKTDQPGMKSTRSTINGATPFERKDRHPATASHELSIVLMAMRKIREAIVASARKDDFASEVYIFIIRSTIPIGHMESYHPALLHLLHGIQPVVPMKESDYHEFLGYYILDLACRQNDLAAAYRVKYCYKYKDAKIEAILKALVHGDWCIFWMLQGLVESRQRRLMQWADQGVRAHALKCIGKSYLSVDKKYLEEAVRCPWEQFDERDGLGWQVNGDTITIKKIGRK